MNTLPIRQHIASGFHVYADERRDAVCLGFSPEGRTFIRYPIADALSPTAAHQAYIERLERRRYVTVLDLTLAVQRRDTAETESERHIFTGSVLTASGVIASLTADIEGLRLIAPDVATLEYTLTFEGE